MDRRGLSYLLLIAGGFAAVGAAMVVANPLRRQTAPLGAPDATTATFVNFETGQVHPVDLTPDRARLLVCNTADNRLEVFDITGGTAVLVSEIPVGLDPISVRARSNTEAWVVNNISDSVSIVNLAARNVVATIKTKNEPSDVVFAGSPQRAFVTCSQAALVEVFDPANPASAPTDITIRGQDPRALAVSPDGQTVYAAIFNSGNASTLLGGGAVTNIAFPPNVVNNGSGPYGGTNPPPNSGTAFNPPINPAVGVPPPVGLIVKKNAAGQWMDDNNQNWTPWVSGPNAALSGRPVGWDLPDRDVAIISTSNLAVTYATGLMNICAAIGVNPTTGTIAVVGTDGTNQVRFEPIVSGRFVRVDVAIVDPVTLGKTVLDLNPHLTYTTSTLPLQADRDRAIGDPRGIAWNSAGTVAYVTGLGSDNVILIDSTGARLSTTIPVGEGPTGLALDDGRNRLYVLNRFAGSISVVDTPSTSVVATVPFYDPTPTPIKVGRKHLYSTHKNSGLGQASCASCHVDSRMDNLAWDLGNPAGTIKQLTGQNLGAGILGLAPPTTPGFLPWHPMKGPMTTQTLQDIIGKEPLHWRGDRAGLEEFNPAFMSLLGDDVQLTPAEMQEFEDFLATIAYPPNPFRNFDNTLPQNLSLPGQFTTGRFGPAGQPLPVGHPNAGLALYTDTNRRLDGGAFACATCHTLPAGVGPDLTFNFGTGSFQQFPVGAAGEHHAALVAADGSTNRSIKIPQIRNAYFKIGFDCTQLENTRGFGFLHDGSVDSIARFVNEPVFTPPQSTNGVSSDQETADLVSFIMCMSGSDLPSGSLTNLLFPPGLSSKDVPAAVGAQTTVSDGANVPAPQAALINQMIALAQVANSRVGVVVKGLVNGEQRGFVYRSTNQMFQSDRAAQVLTPAQLLALARPGNELTYTVVPKNEDTRIGIDRDEDGVLDGDVCYANCDQSVTPPVLNVNDFICFQSRFAAGDPWANCDGSTVAPILNVNDFICFQSRFAQGCP